MNTSNSADCMYQVELNEKNIYHCKQYGKYRKYGELCSFNSIQGQNTIVIIVLLYVNGNLQ